MADEFTVPTTSELWGNANAIKTAIQADDHTGILGRFRVADSDMFPAFKGETKGTGDHDYLGWLNEQRKVDNIPATASVGFCSIEGVERAYHKKILVGDLPERSPEEWAESMETTSKATRKHPSAAARTEDPRPEEETTDGEGNTGPSTDKGDEGATDAPSSRSIARFVDVKEWNTMDSAQKRALSEGPGALYTTDPAVRAPGVKGAYTIVNLTPATAPVARWTGDLMNEDIYDFCTAMVPGNNVSSHDRDIATDHVSRSINDRVAVCAMVDQFTQGNERVAGYGTRIIKGRVQLLVWAAIDCAKEGELGSHTAHVSKELVDTGALPCFTETGIEELSKKLAVMSDAVRNGVDSQEGRRAVHKELFRDANRHVTDMFESCACMLEEREEIAARLMVDSRQPSSNATDDYERLNMLAYYATITGRMGSQCFVEYTCNHIQTQAELEGVAMKEPLQMQVTHQMNTSITEKRTVFSTTLKDEMTKWINTGECGDVLDGLPAPVAGEMNSSMFACLIPPERHVLWGKSNDGKYAVDAVQLAMSHAKDSMLMPPPIDAGAVANDANKDAEQEDAEEKAEEKAEEETEEKAKEKAEEKAEEGAEEGAAARQGGEHPDAPEDPITDATVPHTPRDDPARPSPPIGRDTQGNTSTAIDDLRRIFNELKSRGDPPTVAAEEVKGAEGEVNEDIFQDCHTFRDSPLLPEGCNLAELNASVDGGALTDGQFYDLSREMDTAGQRRVHLLRIPITLRAWWDKEHREFFVLSCHSITAASKECEMLSLVNGMDLEHRPFVDLETRCIRGLADYMGQLELIDRTGHPMLKLYMELTPAELVACLPHWATPLPPVVASGGDAMFCPMARAPGARAQGRSTLDLADLKACMKNPGENHAVQGYMDVIFPPDKNTPFVYTRCQTAAGSDPHLSYDPDSKVTTLTFVPT